MPKSRSVLDRLCKFFSIDMSGHFLVKLDFSKFLTRRETNFCFRNERNINIDCAGNFVLYTELNGTLFCCNQIGKL